MSRKADSDRSRRSVMKKATKGAMGIGALLGASGTASAGHSGTIYLSSSTSSSVPVFEIGGCCSDSNNADMDHIGYEDEGCYPYYTVVKNCYGTYYFELTNDQFDGSCNPSYDVWASEKWISYSGCDL